MKCPGSYGGQRTANVRLFQLLRQQNYRNEDKKKPEQKKRRSALVWRSLREDGEMHVAETSN
jgi:hypothetical protein